MTEETKTRISLATGTLLACVAYLVFLGTESLEGFIISLLLLIGGILVSIFGICRWHLHQRK
jgi:hypothetical protein